MYIDLVSTETQTNQFQPGHSHASGNHVFRIVISLKVYARKKKKTLEHRDELVNHITCR